MPSLGIIADDLTGALDTAAGFTGDGGSVDVVTSVGANCNLNRIAIDSGTRDVESEGDARRAVVRLLECIVDKDIAFKKIDSLMRGHLVGELAAIMETRAFDFCLLAPAFPAEKRYTVAGQQWLHTSNGSPTRIGPKLPDALGHYGISAQIVSPTSEMDTTKSGRIFVADARTDDDLRTISRRVEDRTGRWLYCGTAGLSRALARSFPVQAQPAMAPLILFIGSANQVSHRQVDFLYGEARRRGREPRIDQRFREGCLIADCFGPDRVVVRAEFSGDRPRAIKSQEIVTILTRSLRRFERLGSLIVVGGASLRQVIEQFGVARLSVTAEIAPGIPSSKVIGGPLEGVTLTSKSGAFGDDATLYSLMYQ